jgi:hypothetical protein
MVFDSDVLDLSASNYIADLKALIKSDRSPPCRDVATVLLKVVETALRDRAGLRAAAIPELRPLLDRVPVEERPFLINQSSLGLGRQDADLLIVGQEHAYDLTDTANLALEGCGLTVLWLCGGRSDVAVRFSAANRPRPFTVYPNDYYPNRSPGHTWHHVSKLLGVQNSWDFGERAHLIEISAHPSRSQPGGQPPTRRRMDFLGSMLRRSTVRTVVFHGTARRQEQLELAARRLGIAEAAPNMLRTVPSLTGKRATKIEGQQVGGVQVLFCKMLSGNARPSTRFIDTLRTLL